MYKHYIDADQVWTFWLENLLLELSRVRKQKSPRSSQRRLGFGVKNEDQAAQEA